MLGTFLVPHVRHGIRQEQPSDRVPCPGLHPPSRNDETDVGLDAPRVACVGYDDHREVDSVALRVDYRDDPQSLRREGGVAHLLEESVVRPEEIENGVEVGKGVWQSVRHVKGDIAGLLLVLINVCCSQRGGQDLGNGQCYGCREPKAEASAEYSAGNSCLARVLQVRYADRPGREEDER